MPNIFADTRGTSKKINQLFAPGDDTAIQALPFGETRVGLNVLQGPFKLISGTPSTTPLVLLPARKGVRYFIHTAFVSYRTIAGDATTEIYVGCRVDGTTYVAIDALLLAGSANQGGYSTSMDILTDPNQAVTGNAAGGNPTAAQVGVTYAIVRDINA